MRRTIRYQTGGALPAGSSQYVRRKADDDIWEFLEAGEFCFLLAPRQTGKSSLQWQIVSRLRDEGVFVTTVSLQGMSGSNSEAEFYDGVVDGLAKDAKRNIGFSMPFVWSEWWPKQKGPVARRFVEFVSEAFLRNTGHSQRWVIAIDEFDILKSFDFSGSFITAITQMHSDRNRDERLKDLSFILISADWPESISKSAKLSASALSICEVVHVEPFSLEQTQEFAISSSQIELESLTHIYSWAQGQPQLTTTIWNELVQRVNTDYGSFPEANNKSQCTKYIIDDFIANHYLDPADGSIDGHLVDVGDSAFGKKRDDKAALKAFALALTQNGFESIDEDEKAAERRLLTSGIAIRASDKRVRPANRIYSSVFGVRWIENSINEPRVTSSLLLDDLRVLTRENKLLAIIGSGISVGAVDGNMPRKVASWAGFLKSGVDRVMELGSPPPPEGWRDRVVAQIDSCDLVEMLLAAENISIRLNCPHAEYSRWLRETVGKLQVSNGSVYQALDAMQIPLATTNYDGLIEEITKRAPVVWNDRNDVQQYLEDRDHRRHSVLHLHGYYKKPESIVLGLRSYQKVIDDEFAQTVNRALDLTQSLLFVGCGDGLADPNFDALRKWLREKSQKVEKRHYRLALNQDVARLRREHDGERILVIGYGESHHDLAPFLQGLVAGS